MDMNASVHTTWEYRPGLLGLWTWEYWQYRGYWGYGHECFSAHNLYSLYSCIHNPHLYSQAVCTEAFILNIYHCNLKHSSFYFLNSSYFQKYNPGVT